MEKTATLILEVKVLVTDAKIVNEIKQIRDVLKSYINNTKGLVFFIKRLLNNGSISNEDIADFHILHNYINSHFSNIEKNIISNFYRDSDIFKEYNESTKSDSLDLLLYTIYLVDKYVVLINECDITKEYRVMINNSYDKIVSIDGINLNEFFNNIENWYLDGFLLKDRKNKKNSIPIKVIDFEIFNLKDKTIEHADYKEIDNMLKHVDNEINKAKKELNLLINQYSIIIETLEKEKEKLIDVRDKINAKRIKRDYQSLFKEYDNGLLNTEELIEILVDEILPELDSNFVIYIKSATNFLNKDKILELIRHRLEFL